MAVDPNVDSDGELSVNKQHATPAPATPAPTAPAPVAAPQPQPQQQVQVSAAPPQFNMGAALQATSIASLPPGTMLPGSHQVAAAAAAAAAALSRPHIFTQMQPPSVAHPVMTNATRLTFANPATRPTAVLLFPRPQLAVTSMTPLLVPPRGLGAPQMLTLPGMLPQPSGMMPMPPAQFQTVPQQQVPPQHVPVPVPQPVQPEPRSRPQLPTPPSMPMPEQMREKGPGIRDTPPPVREYTPPVRSEVPGQLREGHPQHYSPSHDTPPPPPPRNMRPDQRTTHGPREQIMHDPREQIMHDPREQIMHDPREQIMHDPREQTVHDPRRNSDPREQTEFRAFNNRESSYPNHEFDQVPRDPRKARDIPPPPPPRNGAMR